MTGWPSAEGEEERQPELHVRAPKKGCLAPFLFVAILALVPIAAIVTLVMTNPTPRVSPTPPIETPPLTLAQGTSDVETFLERFGIGSWQVDPMLSGFLITGTGEDGQPCAASIVVLPDLNNASEIELHCMTSGSSSTYQRAASLALTTVQVYAGSEAEWAQTIISLNRSGSFTKATGAVVVTISVAPSEQIDLQVIAKAFA